MKKKKIIQIVVAISAFYIFLMLMLYVAETIPENKSGSIDSIGDAAWYVLATLTTVGYGDTTPVTLPGKIIGAVMMLSSAGVLTFLIGLVFTVLFGRLLPYFNLWRLRKRDWYIFSSLDERSQLLAEGLAKDDPNAVYIFSGSDENVSQDHFPSMKHHVILDAPIEVIANKQQSTKQCYIFLVTAEKWTNYSLGLGLIKKLNRNNIRFFCEADFEPDHIPGELTLFNKADNVARSYWTDHPVKEEEKRILLIGDGRIAQRLLERGLLINVFGKGHILEYHVFGKWDNFFQNHYELGNTIGINVISEDEDSLIWEEGTWSVSAELIINSDRIIICGDDEYENMSIMSELKHYYPTAAQVDVYSGLEDERCRCFGGDNRMLTREIVMHEKLNRIAMRLNELYCEKTGNGSRWENLQEFHRESNIAAADHILTKIRLLCPEDDVCQVTAQSCQKAYSKYNGLNKEQKELCRWVEHKRWMRFHIINNWCYSAVRDNEMRHHTLLKPYEELSDEEKALDDSAWEIIGGLDNI